MSLVTQAQQGINPNDKLPVLLKALNSYKGVVAQVAPKNGIGVERILGISAHIIKSNPKIAECNPQSIVSAVIMAAMTGLDPNPAAGQVSFVPYGGQVQMQYGYKGEVNLAYRTGVIETIYARAVYEGDFFKHHMGSNEWIEHEEGPNFGEANPSLVVGSYAVAYLKGSKRPVNESLNRKQIERLRNKSQMQKIDKLAGAWATDYDMMARKSAIRRLVEKELPTSIEWNDIASFDGAIGTTLDAFKRDGSGLVDGPEYPQEPPRDINATVETKGGE